MRHRSAFGRLVLISILQMEFYTSDLLIVMHNAPRRSGEGLWVASWLSIPIPERIHENQRMGQVPRRKSRHHMKLSHVVHERCRPRVTSRLGPSMRPLSHQTTPGGIIRDLIRPPGVSYATCRVIRLVIHNIPCEGSWRCPCMPTVRRKHHLLPLRLAPRFLCLARAHLHLELVIVQTQLAPQDASR